MDGPERSEVTDSADAPDPQSGSTSDPESAPVSTPAPEVPELPEPIQWRPVIIWKAVAFGALADVGFEVVMQQLGVTLLTPASLFFNLLEGAALGVIAPNLGALIGSWWTNRQIRNVRQEVPA